MKKLLLLGTLAAALGTVPSARADVLFSVNLGLPGLFVNIGTLPPPIYFTPAPVYFTPAPVYFTPAPVYVTQPPAYVPPVAVVTPRRYYVRSGPVYGVTRPPAIVYRPYRPYATIPAYSR